MKSSCTIYVCDALFVRLTFSFTLNSCLAHYHVKYRAETKQFGVFLFCLYLTTFHQLDISYGWIST